MIADILNAVIRPFYMAVGFFLFCLGVDAAMIGAGYG